MLFKQREKKAQHLNAALPLKASGRHPPGQAASSRNSVARPKVVESIKTYEVRDSKHARH